MVKGKAIGKEIGMFYSQYAGQSWKNIISIGDSDFERLGTQAATGEYLEQAAKGDRKALRSVKKGAHTVEMVVGDHVYKVRTKTFKIVDQPTVEELVVEVHLMKKWIALMVKLDSGFDINID